LEGARSQFEEAMNDDFNSPRAFAALFDLSRDVNAYLSSKPTSRPTLEAIDGAYRRMAEEALGIRLADQAPGGTAQADQGRLDGVVRILIDMRQEARKTRDWARADTIRNRLAELGIALEDGSDGTRWRLSR
jgi:cysteinyl-tRNA synthetase